MNRPSPDDMKEIMMAELREENKKLKKKLDWFERLLFTMAIIIPVWLCLLGYYWLL